MRIVSGEAKRAAVLVGMQLAEHAMFEAAQRVHFIGHSHNQTAAWSEKRVAGFERRFWVRNMLQN